MKKNFKILALIPFVGMAIQAHAAGGTGSGSTSTDMNRNAPGSAAAGSPSVLDQSSGSTADVEVTRSIREALGNSNNLSTSAKNVEVVTLNNTVTLRGTVASQSERTQVISAAQRAAGNRQIRNEITVNTATR